MCLSVRKKDCVKSRASALHPSNKMELIMCIHHKLCTSEKNMIRTHVGDAFTCWNIALCYARVVLHTDKSISNKVFYCGHDGTLRHCEAFSIDSNVWQPIHWLWIQQNVLHWKIETNEFPDVHSKRCICDWLSTPNVIVGNE